MEPKLTKEQVSEWRNRPELADTIDCEDLAADWLTMHGRIAELEAALNERARCTCIVYNLTCPVHGELRTNPT